MAAGRRLDRDVLFDRQQAQLVDGFGRQGMEIDHQMRPLAGGRVHLRHCDQAFDDLTEPLGLAQDIADRTLHAPPAGSRSCQQLQARRA